MLLDENVECDLRTQGHDAEHVEQVPALGRGAAGQADIIPNLQRSGRSILTYDSHFTGQESSIDPAE